MPKDKSATDAGTAKPKVDAEALRAEVKAFASQLGFSAASAGGFDYDDFAPEKAAKQIKQPQQSAGKVSGKDATKQQQNNKQQQPDRHQDRKQQHQDGRRGQNNQQQLSREQQIQQAKEKQQQEKEEQHLNAVRNRTWVESVGPRPGT